MEFIEKEDVAGFTFGADVLCCGCVWSVARDKVRAWGGPVFYDDDVHSLIGEWARREFPKLGIWAQGAFWTYDTTVYGPGELPKPFTADQVEDGEECHSCGKRLDRVDG